VGPDSVGISGSGSGSGSRKFGTTLQNKRKMKEFHERAGGPLWMAEDLSGSLFLKRNMYPDGIFL
jgi:hypothetical protein